MKNEIIELVNKADAVIFDMDGVIINSEILKFRGYKYVFKKYFNIEIEEEDTGWRGKTEKKVFEYWFEKKKIDNKFDLSMLIEEKRKFYREILDSGKIDEIPGAVLYIQSLDRAGKKLGLATSSNRADQEKIFKIFGLNGKFISVLTLEDVKNHKPDPEVYLKSLSAIGNISPEKTVVFEDTPVGAKAAINAGTVVVALLTSYNEDDFDGVKYFIKDFE